MDSTKKDLATKRKEVLEKIEKEYDFVRLTWANMCGIAQTITVPAHNVRRFMDDGVGFFGSVMALGPTTEVAHVGDVEKRGFRNVAYIPVPDTFHLVPWAGNGKYKIGELFCESFWEDGNHQGACTRAVARKQVEELNAHGYSIKAAFEMEYMIYTKSDNKLLYKGTRYLSPIEFGLNEDLFLDLCRNMNDAGVDCEKVQVEFSPGQMESTFVPTTDMKGADDAFLFKYGLKEMCERRGFEATFMAITEIGNVGNGGHYNHSVWDIKSGKNAFADETSSDKLSAFAKHWLAGLVKHSPALAAVCNPTVNCYRRLGKNFAPDKANWGVEDRMANFRAKSTSHSATYVESRCPSGVNNPYLTLAVHIAAGLDGVKNKLPCPEPTHESGELLPGNLEDALKALEADTVIVESLGKEFVEWFCDSRREIDLVKFKDSDVTKTVGEEENMAKEIEEYRRVL